MPQFLGAFRKVAKSAY